MPIFSLVHFPLRELRETKTWRRLIRKADLLSAERLHKITDETDQLCAILSQSVHTVKAKVRG
jgi:four helix bundle protein